MNDSRKAKRTRNELIKQEQKRLQDAEKRIEALKRAHAEIAKPIQEFREAEQKMRDLGREIDGMIRTNAAQKGQFHRELAASADPRLLRLVSEARQQLNRRSSTGSATEITRVLHIREWLDEAEPSLEDPTLDDDHIDGLIQRGERILSPAKELEHAS